MNAKNRREQPISMVKILHDDMIKEWGESWKTELLGRLMTDSPNLQNAWKEIANRSHQPTPESADQLVSIYGLCFEFLDIRRDAFEAHPTPKEQTERFQNIVKSASWLAIAINGTKLDRVADPFLEATPAEPTPLLSTLLNQLASEAGTLSEASQAGPHLLERPGASNSTRTYVIRRLATLFQRSYGERLQRTIASFTEAIIGEEEEVTVEQVNSALQNWTPVKFDNRGEYP